MIKTDDLKRDYELEWAEAEIEFAVLVWENYKWLHPNEEVKDES